MVVASVLLAYVICVVGMFWRYWTMLHQMETQLWKAEQGLAEIRRMVAPKPRYKALTPVPVTRDYLAEAWREVNAIAPASEGE